LYDALGGRAPAARRLDVPHPLGGAQALLGQLQEGSRFFAGSLKF
jgi:hypothetical protein